MNWGHFPVQWLAQQARPFLVNSKNVQVICSPDLFFETLKKGILGARKRVVLSSLYLGTGSREDELVDCFHKSLSDPTRRHLRCSLLLDHLRGSRGHPNSRTMVQLLVPDFGGRFTLGLYHTPSLRGVIKAVVPERFNEVMGLQHMKIYLFDDDVLISGANLSQDYFVDRQDRYFLFKNSKKLADFFAAIVDSTVSHSFTLNPDGSTSKPAALSANPLESRRTAGMFRASLRRAITQLTATTADWPASQQAMECSPELDTVVFPLIQMGFCGITQEETVTLELFKTLDKEDSLFLASGYFNLPPLYSRALLDTEGRCDVLAASPQANGFYGARGVAGHVPAMYNHFARKFLESVVRTRSEKRVRYWEYTRPGWTFHGKGVWFYPRGEKWPVATLVGSSNYGYRSLTRDLEAQVAMVTRDPELRKALHEERTRMFEHSHELTLEKLRSDPTRKLTTLEWIATVFLQPHV